MNYGTIHDLVFRLLPPMNVRVGPAQILIAVGLTGLVWFEWRTWRKNR